VALAGKLESELRRADEVNYKLACEVLLIVERPPSRTWQRATGSKTSQCVWLEE